MMASRHAKFAQFIGNALPSGGCIMRMLEAYFDESQSHKGKPFLCVAGCIFESEQAIVFDEKWRVMLGDFDLPYFRMSACEARAKPFEHLEREVRTAIQGRAARLINEHISHGVVVSVNPEEYIRITPPHPLIAKQPYTFCVHGSFVAVKQMADADKFDGKIAYVFEAGHEHQNETDKLMRYYMNAPGSIDIFRYQSHSFVGKQDSTPLQAADFLAWHSTTNFKRTESDHYSRNDFAEFVDDRYWRWHFDRSSIEQHAEIVRRADAAFPEAGKF